MFQTGKLAQVNKQFRNCKIDLLGLSEVRWPGNGRMMTEGHTLLYSGRKDNEHQAGMAILMRGEVLKSMIEWKPITERIITARFYSRFAKLTTIVCYAPTEDAEEDEKDHFYQQLQQIIRQVPRHDMLLLMGDLNTKIGSSNKSRERIMSVHGIGVMNNNGEMLANLFYENDLIIGGSIFQHKTIHKYTWTSPDGNSKNQIDHIVINRRWRKSVIGVRTIRGNRVGSDHQLLMSKIKLKLMRNKKSDNVREKMFDNKRLKDPSVNREFQIELKNRFSILQEKGDVTIATINEAVRQTAEKTIGYQQKHRKQWITEETWNKIENRKKIKAKWMQTRSDRLKDQLRKQYNEMDKDVKYSAQKDKKKHVENLATGAEEAVQRQDMKSLYRVTNELVGGYKNVDSLVKDKEGKQITEEKEKIKRTS